MAQRSDQRFIPRARWHTPGALAAVLVVGCMTFGGCSVIRAVKKVAHDVESNKTTIDAFTNKIQSSASTTFEATYVTTGSSPATIVYAVRPPKGLAFTETPSGGASNKTTLDVVVNSSGEYSCTPPAGSGAKWTCERLPATSTATLSKIFDFYTPTHWVAFLKDFSLAAGFAGDKVSSSTMTVNGFAMSCVDFVASGVPGTSTICTTSQGILGYVKVAADATSFEIKSYSASPQDSLFQIPPGAKVTTITTTTTSGS